MPEQSHPPPPDDEARFDDEGSAVGKPEPAADDKTAAEHGMLSPKRGGAFRNLINALRGKRG